MDVPRLLTVGRIAEELGEPLHRVLHVLRTRPYLAPAARAGTLRLYRRHVIGAVRRELLDIGERRGQPTALRLVAAEGRP